MDHLAKVEPSELVQNNLPSQGYAFTFYLNLIHKHPAFSSRSLVPAWTNAKRSRLHPNESRFHVQRSSELHADRVQLRRLDVGFDDGECRIADSVIGKTVFDLLRQKDPRILILQTSQRNFRKRSRLAKVDDRIAVYAFISLPAAETEVGAASNPIHQRFVAAARVLRSAGSVQPDAPQWFRVEKLRFNRSAPRVARKLRIRKYFTALRNRERGRISQKPRICPQFPVLSSI